MQQQILLAIVLLPLIGFIFNFFIYPLMVGGMQKTKLYISGSVATIFISLSFILSIVAFINFTGELIRQPLFTWINLGETSLKLGLELDALNALLILIITGIGSLIHLYSIGYMHHEPGVARFFSYLNLFCFMMLILVLSDSLLLTFFGWEGVGLASFLLIGYWYKNPEYTYNARKAFIVNRVADVFFVVGMFILYYAFNTFEYQSIKTAILTGSNLNLPLLSTAVLCLFIGASGKSAQFPLHIWLPDAMVGPTPVSALIHAATMVTAGVFLCVKLHPLLDLAPHIMLLVATIGAITALMGALIATFQDDIKKVLAYSTVSQLGFMFLAVGVGAYTSAIFHLMSHAFFKALLFLGSGSVIHGDNGNQNIKFMGGLRHKMPVTFVTFSIGLFALCGLPFFSGYFSKDEILYNVLSGPVAPKFLFGIGLLAALTTALYSGRLYKLTFFGTYRGQNQVHESGALMLIPLVVLSVFATLFGFYGFSHDLALSLSLHIPHGLEEHFKGYITSALVKNHVLSENFVSLMATLLALVGMAFGFNNLAKNNTNPKVFANKFYIDEIYNYLILVPLKKFMSLIYSQIEHQFFRLKTFTVSNFVYRYSELLKIPHRSGDVSIYGLFMLVSLVIFLVFFMGK